MKISECTFCGGLDHTSIMCFYKPRRVKKQYKPPKGYNNEKAAYAHWYRENPPDENDLWYCHYCGVPLTKNIDKLSMGVQRITIDHYVPRSNDIKLKYEPKNFVASCFKCNTEKGSMHGDLYKMHKKSKEGGLQMY